MRRGGVTLVNISYSDGVIATLLSRARRSFVVRYDPRDMSQVYLRDPDGIYWPIPYIDRRLPAVTLSEINAVRRRLLDAGHGRLTQTQVFAALDQQRQLTEQAAGKSKAARRDRERARRGLLEATTSPTPDRSRHPPRLDDVSGHDAITPFAVEEWS